MKFLHFYTSTWNSNLAMEFVSQWLSPLGCTFTSNEVDSFSIIVPVVVVVAATASVVVAAAAAAVAVVVAGVVGTAVVGALCTSPIMSNNPPLDSHPILIFSSLLRPKVTESNI